MRSIKSRQCPLQLHRKSLFLQTGRDSQQSPGALPPENRRRSAGWTVLLFLRGRENFGMEFGLSIKIDGEGERRTAPNM